MRTRTSLSVGERHVDRVGDARRRDPSAAALGVGDQNLVEKLDAARSRDPPGNGKAIGLRRSAADDHGDPLRIRTYQAGHLAHRLGAGRPRRFDGRLLWRGGKGKRSPGGVGGQDHGGDTRRRQRGLNGGGNGGTDVSRILHAPDPVRHRRGQALDVGRQRCVEREVMGGVVANDVDDSRPGAAGVVQVGKAVGKARAGVQKGRCRAPGHARIAIGGAGHEAFAEAEDAAQLRLAVECRDEVHFRGAGIGEADVDAVCKQRIDKHIRAGGAKSLAAFSHARIPRWPSRAMIAATCAGATGEPPGAAPVGQRQSASAAPAQRTGIRSAARRGGRQARSALCRRRAASGAAPCRSGASVR